MAFDMTALPVHPKAGKPAHAYIYRDAAGAPVLIANRYQRPGQGKFFLPYDVARGEWKAPASRPLYQLDRLTATTPDDLVLLVEGEKCADALASLGFLATTTFGGCKALAKTDLAPLAGRRVAIWPDHDAPGRAYAEQAGAALTALGCTVTPLQIDANSVKFMLKQSNSIQLEPGWDAADAVAAGLNSAQLQAFIRTQSQPEYAAIQPNSSRHGTAPTASLSCRWP